MYMQPLGFTFLSSDFPFHCFADDVLIYMPMNNENNSDDFEISIRLSAWNQNMDGFKLPPSQNETEVIVFRTKYLVDNTV